MIIKANSVYMPLADKSVQAIITSPPYWSLRRFDISDVEFLDGWIGQLGLEPTLELYIEHLMQFMAECKRVLKNNGVVFINLGDTYAGTKKGNTRTDKHLKATSSAFTKRKPVNYKSKSLCFIPEQVALACLKTGWIIRNKIIWYKPNGMPTSAPDRFGNKWEQIYMMTLQEKYYFDLDAVREKTGTEIPREQYLKGKAWGNHKHDLEKGNRFENYVKRCTHPNGKNPGDLWSISNQPYPGAHYATFPSRLVERMLLCSTGIGDVVLDPFGGAGTVGKVALKYRRKPVLLDLGYQQLQVERLREDRQSYLF